jgi:hypothetical protein
MRELPKRRVKTDNIIIKKDYSYSDIVKNNIDLDKINAIVFSVSDLANNMTVLLDYLSLSSNIQLKFKDFESSFVIDRIIKKPIENKTFLLDDGKLIDRSYIDLTQLRNIDLTIPLNYLMWGVKFKETINTYCFLCKNKQSGYFNPTSLNGNEKLNYEDFKKIRNKIEELSKLSGNDSKDKVALISDYIQSCTQYIDGYESESSKGIFITPDFPKFIKYRDYSGLVETVLNNNNGVCMGIANLSTLLLNNEIMNVETESVYGASHVWNKVLIDGKHYYFDNTWSITRNENMCEEGLVALSFTKKYLLFGNETANSMGHHEPQSLFIYDGVISEDDIKNIDYESVFEYNKKPIYRSRKK